jgi:hypothetical protein
MTATRERALLLAILTVFACRAILVSVMVPPWQGPDEPTHFALAWELSIPNAARETADLVLLPDRANVTDTIVRDVQRQVLASMARHRWWEPYGRRAPNPLPTLFVEADAMSAGSLAQPLYYGLGALVLRVGGGADVEHAYARLRWLSVVLALVTLMLGWTGTRMLFGPSAAAGAVAIGALHPQFLLTAISVNPDALVNVVGAFVWWQCARVITDRQRAMSFVLLVVAAMTALLIKRSAIPLALMTLAAGGWLLNSSRWRTSGQWMAAGLVLMGAVTVVTLLLLVGLEPRLAAIWKSAFIVRRPLGAAALAALPDYLRLTVDDSWFVAGWERFPAPEGWYAVARAITVLGAVGALLALVRSRGEGHRHLRLAWTFLAGQVVAFVGTGFIGLASPQGRFLFSMLAPMTLLLWIGVEQIVPSRWRAHAGPVLLGVLAIMNVAAIMDVLLPAYVPFTLRVQ